VIAASTTQPRPGPAEAVPTAQGSLTRVRPDMRIALADDFEGRRPVRGTLKIMREIAKITGNKAWGATPSCMSESSRHHPPRLGAPIFRRRLMGVGDVFLCEVYRVAWLSHSLPLRIGDANRTR
jgi:hypothetical protein